MVYTSYVGNETTQTKTIPESGITRTSVNIPTDIWEDLKVAAIRRKMSFGEAVEAAIRLWVDGKLPGEEAADTRKRKAS